jgi:hypothetical protein
MLAFSSWISIVPAIPSGLKRSVGSRSHRPSFKALYLTQTSVIASEAKQSRVYDVASGLPRFARNDEYLLETHHFWTAIPQSA